MQCRDDGLLFHIGISPNGYHGTSASSTTQSLEVCKILRDIDVIFRLSRGCTFGRNWLRPQYWTSCCPPQR